jgi:O-antigen ligase
MFSLRVLFCLALVLFFSWYSYRDWFVGACAAVVLMAFVKHPDMPHNIAGIPGGNLWNVLIINVLIAWWRQRWHEEGHSPVPRIFKVAVGLYLAVVVVSFLRFFLHPSVYYDGTRVDIFIEFLLNSLRLLIPGLLFYDGCHTYGRVKAALGMIVFMYFLLAIQVVRYVGIHPNFSGAELSDRGGKFIQASVGYDRVDMSMMLSGASWAALAFATLIERKSYRWGVRGGALMIMMAQALTGGRAGYIAWGAVGIIMCTIRWRRMLPLIPLTAIGIVMLVPSVAERMFSGFGGTQGGIVIQQNDFEITSGRNTVWPLVIAKIKENPLVGYGRQAMITTGLRDYVAEVLHDSFPHPHEAYLEILLDDGIIGFLCIVPIYFIALKRSTGLFLDRSSPAYEAAGGIALALVLGLLFAGFGAQTLYPREGVVGMWAAVGVALRVSAERERKWIEEEDASYAEEGKAEDVEESNFVGSARMAVS